MPLRKKKAAIPTEIKPAAPTRELCFLRTRIKRIKRIMNIVQKRDIYGNWIDVLHAQQGHVALECYQSLEQREGKDNVRILQQ